MQSLPEFKSTEAMAYPLARLGRAYVAETPRGVAPGSAGAGAGGNGGDGGPGDGGLILLCDDRFANSIGAACGGPAETAAVTTGGAAARPLLDRFEAAPGRFVSVYGELAGGG